MVGRRAGGLDDEDVLAPDIFLDFDEGLAVGKRRDGAFAQFHADGGGDAFGQRRIGRAGKNLHDSYVNSMKKKPPSGGSVCQQCNNRDGGRKHYSRPIAPDGK